MRISGFVVSYNIKLYQQESLIVIFPFSVNLTPSQPVSMHLKRHSLNFIANFAKLNLRLVAHRCESDLFASDPL